ncbi:hypothetical protein BJY00DRAFT_289485 [Aspergillus carlsbadensis]|nr:hypothetical protein BJY00DRAFT_289485 [Aspergillus carlsbadensis]
MLCSAILSRGCEAENRELKSRMEAIGNLNCHIKLMSDWHWRLHLMSIPGKSLRCPTLSAARAMWLSLLVYSTVRAKFRCVGGSSCTEVIQCSR